MTRDDLTGVPDGGVLRRLSNSIQIVRRRKHEPIAFAALTRQELIEATGKQAGSKFLEAWDLHTLTD